MSTLSKKINALYDQLDVDLKESSNGLSSNAMSLESIAESNSVGAEFEDIGIRLKTAAQELGHLLDTDAGTLESDECLKAGTIAYMASKDPLNYMRDLRVRPTDSLSMESVLTGVGGEVPTIDWESYSQESFDEASISGMATHNAIINMIAARQEPGIEALFPTKVYAATDSGIKLSVDQQEVIREVPHPKNGGLIELDRKRLLRGFIDPEILAARTTNLIPWANPTGEADENFVDPAIIGNKVIAVDREVSVPTRPLAIGREFNILGLSQHPGMTKNNRFDLGDQVAYGAKLKNLYLSIGEGPTEKAILFAVSQLTRVDFIKSIQGKGRDTTLNFITTDLILDETVSDISGALVTELQDTIIAPKLLVRLKVSVTGNMNLNTGTTEVNTSPVTVYEILDTQGERLSLKEGQGKAVVDKLKALKIRAFGMDIDAKASNSNWRFDGPIIDVTPYEEIYLIPASSPITVITPPLEQQNGRKIQGMANAIKVLNTNNAITTMINYFGELITYREASARGAMIQIAGIARHLVDPYANTIQLDVYDRLKNIESTDRHDSVASVIVYQLRTEAWNMYRDSAYGCALKAQTGGGSDKPHVVLLTDSVIANHLNTLKGEAQIERMLGDHMTCEVHVIDDVRLKGKIWMTFGRGRPGVEDLLGFGVHAYIPELTQQLTVDRNGATRVINRMIPRNFHLPILPILVCVEVSRIEEALNNKL